MTSWGGPARVAAAGVGRFFRDGAFKVAVPHGAPVPEMPFQKEGDRTTIIIKQKYLQAIESWQALPAYSTHPDFPGFYLINETTPQDQGAGIGLWERWYCPVPIPHYEYEAFPYSFQYAASSTAFGSITKSVTSKILYEYFLAQDQAAFPILKKCALFVLPTTVLNASAQGGGITVFESGTGSLGYDTPGAFVVSADAFVVGEDSKTGIWNYPILFRATRYVPGPTTADLGNVWTGPGTSTGNGTGIGGSSGGGAGSSAGFVGVNGNGMTVSMTAATFNQSLTLTFTPPAGATFPAGTSFSAPAGTFSNVAVAADGSTATATYVAPATASTFFITSSNGLSVQFWVNAAGTDGGFTNMSVSPNTASKGATVTLTLIGTFPPGTTFSCSAGTLSNVAVPTNGGTSATATFAAPNGSVNVILVSNLGQITHLDVS